MKCHSQLLANLWSATSQHLAQVNSCLSYPLIQLLNAKCEIVFGAHSEYWYKDYKIYLGLLMWASAWRSVATDRDGKEQDFRPQFVFAFGMNLVIMHWLQYHGAIGIVFSMFFVFTQGSLQVLITSLTTTEKITRFEATTVYQDVGHSMFHVVIIFVGQCMFTALYTTYLLHNLHPKTFNYAYWLCAIVGVQMSCFFNRGSDNLLGQGCQHTLWNSLLRTSHVYEFKHVDQQGNQVGSIKVRKALLMMRGFF